VQLFQKLEWGHHDRGRQIGMVVSYSFEQAKQGKQGTSSQQQQRDNVETYEQVDLNSGKFNANLVAVSCVIRTGIS